MRLPTTVEYPVLAVGDLHGQAAWLDRLAANLRKLPEWPAAKLVFLGDLVDRGPDVRGTVQRVMDLIAERPGSSCVMGNHDLALVGAAGLGGEPSAYWVTLSPCLQTFGSRIRSGSLTTTCAAIPAIVSLSTQPAAVPRENAPSSARSRLDGSPASAADTLIVSATFPAFDGRASRKNQPSSAW